MSLFFAAKMFLLRNLEDTSFLKASNKVGELREGLSKAYFFIITFSRLPSVGVIALGGKCLKTQGPKVPCCFFNPTSCHPIAYLKK